MARQSRLIGFYVLAGVAMWALALGPITSVMGIPAFRARITCSMSLPGIDSLRVPARFWLMSTLCLSVIAGLVVAEFTRGRSRQAMVIAVIVVGIGVLSDGWVDRIPAVSLPPPVPGAATMAGATVLEVPPGAVFRDIQAVFRAVNGGWKTVNGYSGWIRPTTTRSVGAGRDEAETMLTPFQQFGDLHVLVGDDAPRLRDADRAAAGRCAGGERRLVDDRTGCLDVRRSRWPVPPVRDGDLANFDRHVPRRCC